MGLFDKFFSLFKKKKDKEPPTDEKEKSKPEEIEEISENIPIVCLLYTSPSPRDMRRSRMPSSA